MNTFFIFSFSILLSVVTIFIERSVGIGWDYHPDSVTYATKSLEIMAAINENPWIILNAAHYYWVGILGMNIWLVISFNMIFYGLTNSILYNSLLHKISVKNSFLLWIIFIIFIFSPYRLHLSTTLLKDTSIILLLVCIFSFKNKWLPLGLILIWRVAAIFYLQLLIPKRLIFPLIIFAMILVYFNFDYINEYAQTQDLADMRFREFDLVPSFKEFNFFGTLLRMLLWPFFALSGLYLVFSPSAFFFPLVVGSCTSLLVSYYCVTNFRIINFVQIFTVMSPFAFFATGFTTYVRYVYPVIAILPLIFIYYEDKFKK